MIQQQVQLGAERFTISGDDLVSVVEQAAKMKLMHYRLGPGADATIRIRKNDGGDFIEMFSKSLKAVKMVSKVQENGELYIGADTPWVKYDKETQTSSVRFDTLTDQIAELGWTEEHLGHFHPAERVKVKGKMRAWTWKPA